jgi:hypothetical protein
MCALKPKCQFFPFLDWWASGSRECPLVLGGARRLDEGRVHDGASPHHDARRLELRVQLVEHGLAEALPLEDVAELRERRGVGDLLAHEVDVHEPLHGAGVEDGILRALVREAEHDLEQVHPEHRLGAADMPAALLGVVMGLDEGGPPVPGDDRIHTLQELLAPRLPPLPLRFQVAEAHLIAHRKPSAAAPPISIL